MTEPRYDQELNCIVKQANDAIAGTDDCRHHFYAQGDARLLSEVRLGDGQTTLQSGTYRIMRILPSPAAMLLLPSVNEADLSTVAEPTVDAGENSMIRVVGTDCNFFAAERIPSDIRSASDDQEPVAPFHLRDPETDEEPEEFGRLEDVAENHFTDYASAERAARCLTLLTGADVSICNGYSNSIETISPADVDETEAARDKNKIYLRSRSSAPYNPGEEKLTAEERLIRHNAHLATRCPDCRHERHDGRICMAANSKNSGSHYCHCMHGTQSAASTATALTDPPTQPGTAVDVLFASPPCVDHAPRPVKFMILAARNAGTAAGSVGACVLKYDPARGKHIQAAAGRIIIDTEFFDRLEGALPAGFEAKFTKQSPDDLADDGSFGEVDFIAVAGIVSTGARLRYLGASGKFAIITGVGDVDDFRSEDFDF